VTADEFNKQARLGTFSVPVFDVRVTAGSTEITASGLLKVEPSSYRLELGWSEGSLPELPSIIMRKDFWKVNGKFSTGSSFSSEDVPPDFSVTFPSRGKCTLSLESLCFEPEGFDRLTYQEFGAELERVAEIHKKMTKEGDPWTPINPISHQYAASFEVTLPNHSLFFGNREINQRTDHPFYGESFEQLGTALSGECEKFEYCLWKEKNDLEIGIRVKDGEACEDEEEPHRFCRALLNTIAFTHGHQVRPFRFRYRRNHKLISDRFRPVVPGVTTSHIPFPRRLCWESVVNRPPFRFADAFNTILRFFFLNETVGNEANGFLTELRFASAKGISPTHSALALCRIFEGVIDALFEHEGLRTKMEIFPETMCFETAKRETLSFLGHKDGPGFRRLSRCVQSASPITIAEKYRALFRHYAFSNNELFAKILKDWKRRRNPLAHGRQDYSNDQETSENWMAQARIAGGINLLLLRAMGYKGVMGLSSLEDSFVEIR
jgi:hypothetical protein